MNGIGTKWKTLRLAAGVAVVGVLASCAAAEKPKPEAVDEAVVLGEEAMDDLAEAGVPRPEFIETVEHPCQDEEVVKFRMVARYELMAEKDDSARLLRIVHRYWIDEAEYRDVDGGIQWGESGYASTRANDGEVQYSATRQPDYRTINLAVSTECYEDPDPDDWVEPATEPSIRPSETDTPEE
ncbi:hypothetical protein [Salininema proteolyticum]|uniref:Uncharacterized protein n=1 Tax=Salininema proteolyticum TaxID=1607685 RepID=A0ABV8TZY9_9ACTN